MADKNRKSTQFIPGWPTSHAPKNTTESVKTSSVHEEALDLVPINELQQGQLYIVKIKLIAIALFQGWDDEMCCFSILRTDLLEDLRWSEARYLPENFDAYLAFDYAGNPPIHLWTKHLRAVIPINWFNIFEEARHMQRQWNVSYWDAPAVESAKPFYSLTDTPVTEEEEATNQDQITELDDEDDEEDVIQEGTVIGTEMTQKETKYYSPQISRVLPSEPPTSSIVPIDTTTTTTPAMRLQKQYNNKNLVTQQPKNDLNKIEQRKQQQQQQINEDTVDSVPAIINNNRPEVKQRRSFTSFFLKKKKSKKSINSNEDASSKKEMKRKSAPPTPSIDPKHHFKISETDLNQKFKQEIVKEQMTPELTASSNSSTKNQVSSSSSPTVIKTPKNGEVDKLELFDIDSYFDMQATFAFLNNSKQDTFNKKKSIST
ncbi:hypothetical protein HPULCUR_008883 [Helicostylum pulchrum]|uniref:Uncharacterized protein n=1 Tax=Helicostylum pulchrum TaxID=562976 RepID=A0ABP9Y958_9FUNG